MECSCSKFKPFRQGSAVYQILARLARRAQIVYEARMRNFILPVLLLSACASVETQLPTPSQIALAQETRAQEIPAFERYKNMLVRLDSVSAKVLQSNATLCYKTRPDLGIVTHTKKSYSKHIRDGAARWLGAREEPVVFIVRKGSSADKLGIKSGDLLVDDNAKALFANDKHLIKDGKIHIRRKAKSLILKVDPPDTCAYNIHLKTSGAINAYATGKSIIVTTAMMDFAQTDDSLALVIGHELAHNTMDHVPKSIKNYLLSGFAARFTRPFEAEADYVGLYYAVRAGYNITQAEQFWRKLGILNPKSIGRAKTHPTTPNRYVSIQLTRAEIDEKRENNKPLEPNFTKVQKFQK